MKVYIKLVDKTVFDMDIDIHSTVLLLKYKIEEDYNISVNRQRLIYDGITMMDENILEKYNLRENSEIHLVFQMM
jgi:hypothetical protein